jgi:peptide/nickel transport system permease protein
VIAGLGSFVSRPYNRAALVLIVAFALTALAAPWLAAPADPQDPAPFKVVGKTIDRVPHPPSVGIWLGTLPGQLDVFYSLVWGTRDVLRFGLTVAAGTAVLGIALGAISGYAGGTVSGVILRVTDAFLAFPVIAAVWLFEELVLILSGSAGPNAPPPHPLLVLLDRLQLSPLMLALMLFSWMPYTRLIHANVLRVKNNEFVIAARAIGARPLRIVVRHILPSTIAPAIVLFARDVGGVVVLAATFTYIGVGGGSVWGGLLVAGRDWVIGPGGNVLRYWWVYLPATLALVLFGIAWNLLGDGLNQWLNPRTREVR